MADIALGVVVMTRIEKLRRLLESADQQPIKTVYIADAGRMTPEKQEIYDRDFTFKTVVLDLDYEIELGRSRKRIVDELSEEYLLTVDSDHEVPDNVTLLVDQLSERPDIGGIAGSIIEPNKGRLWQSAKDFYEDGNALVRDARHEEKEIEYVADSPFVEFDFIPSAGILRKDCLQDYAWDPKYTNTREHADFYVGHWLKTDWVFGISPEVHFKHYPGGDTKYVSHRHDTERQDFAEEYFLNKWGYEAFGMGEPYWYDTHYTDRTLLDRARNLYQNEGINTLLKKSVFSAPRIARRTISKL